MAGRMVVPHLGAVTQLFHLKENRRHFSFLTGRLNIISIEVTVIYYSDLLNCYVHNWTHIDEEGERSSHVGGARFTWSSGSNSSSFHLIQ